MHTHKNADEISLQIEYTRLETRKTLPGWFDYSLIVLRDSQRLGITVAAVFICAVSIIANLATIIVNIKR